MQQCLKEVDRSHIFVGILGDRYGYCPSKDELDSVKEEYEWIGSQVGYGVSVTELEIYSFALRNPSAVEGRAIFFYRSSMQGCVSFFVSLNFLHI